VDAHAAQNADGHTKPIKLTFALVGLYLHCERGFSGKLVQRTHMALARKRRSWPSFPMPEDRGYITVAEVVAFPAGPGRDNAIHDWSRSVWESYADCRPAIEKLLRENGII